MQPLFLTNSVFFFHSLELVEWHSLVLEGKASHPFVGHLIPHLLCGHELHQIVLAFQLALVILNVFGKTLDVFYFQDLLPHELPRVFLGTQLRRNLVELGAVLVEVLQVILAAHVL